MSWSSCDANKRWTIVMMHIVLYATKNVGKACMAHPSLVVISRANFYVASFDSRDICNYLSQGGRLAVTETTSLQTTKIWLCAT